MDLQPFAEKDLKEGALLQEKGKVGAILFSQGTYQVEVKEGKKGKVFWPFLQLNDEGFLKDHFCTCAKAEETGACVHQAAAWLAIFHGKQFPLHIRFRASLWNQLCEIGARRHGYESAPIQGSLKAGFQFNSLNGKKLFSFRPLTERGKKKIREIILERKPETEETSLKFSNLSPEELRLWQQGNPSILLQYELSFWSDLAKWWMDLQEAGAKYQIEFRDFKESLPKTIGVKFAEIEFEFYIAEVNWKEIIPSLLTVNSPLKVFEFSSNSIKKLIYDPLKKMFILDVDLPIAKGAEKEGVLVGDWLFVPEQGFYPAKMDSLLKNKQIPEDKIEMFLNKHARVIQPHLKGSKLFLDPVTARYHLFFDAHFSLHLICYVFEIGDLQKIGAAYFGRWVYLADKGFYQLENLLFEGKEKVIAKQHVSEFINKHRHWLSGYEGFQTHVSSVESHLTYTLTKEKSLKFDTQLDIAEENEEVVDLGDWIYVKGRGFYVKTSKKLGEYLKPGFTVSQEEISHFIQAHKEELENVPHFFSSHSPLAQSGLHLSLNEKGYIEVAPEYHFLETYQLRKVEIFGDFTFIEKEGFCEITAPFRLPDPYTKKTEIDRALEPYFVFYEIARLDAFIISSDPRLVRPQKLCLQILHIEQEEIEKVQYWVIELEYQSELGAVDVREIWTALNENQKYIFSEAGLIVLKQMRFNWLRGIVKKRWVAKSKKLRLTTLEWMRLFAFEEIQEPKEEKSRQFLEQFKNFQHAEPLNLSGLKSTLRGYQQMGVNWLWFLYFHGLSGLLCDEMGLGKTHQAMALLVAAHNFHPQAKFLVICPTSVIYHWEGLLKKFLPSLRTRVFYGMHRSVENFADQYDILLTSYGLLRSEKKLLSEMTFEIAIFDEIQIAKNAHSQTHKVLKLLQAKTRIGLTGTPIENRLLELKALFDVVLPSYMPTEAVFKELFVNPIEKLQDKEKKQLLAKFIYPFILRRKKSEVLLELPEKIEEIAYADLSDEQKKLYQNTYVHSRDSLFQDLKDPQKPLPYMHVFALLSKLKQICDHPCLVLDSIQDYRLHHSGKWDLFIELLQETRESGQKLVIFSQYLTMLDIIQKYLEEEKINYATIRGSTRDRKEQVEKFQTDPTCEVFVGSLQAAGVGIDLIAGSVVIHYDRWWNPAKENQATDRVHRIGQSRGVQVFKMVTKGTIEEHINRLIDKKLSLLQGVIGYDDQDQIKKLSREELTEMLKLMEADFQEKS